MGHEAAHPPQGSGARVPKEGPGGTWLPMALEPTPSLSHQPLTLVSARERCTILLEPGSLGLWSLCRAQLMPGPPPGEWGRGRDFLWRRQFPAAPSGWPTQLQMSVGGASEGGTPDEEEVAERGSSGLQGAGRWAGAGGSCRSSGPAVCGWSKMKAKAVPPEVSPGARGQAGEAGRSGRPASPGPGDHRAPRGPGSLTPAPQGRKSHAASRDR